MTAWFAFNIASIVQVLAAAGVTGAAVRLYERSRQHKQAMRKQTDDFALAMVESLREEMASMKDAAAAREAASAAREDLCHANLEVVRHELRNVEGMFDGLLLALKHAPADKHAEIIGEVEAQRDDKRRRKTGDLRNQVQAEISAERLKADAAAGKL